MIALLLDRELHSADALSAAAFVFILVWAYLAHVTQLRGAWIIAGGGVALVGYVVLLATNTSGGRLAGAFFAVIGIYASKCVHTRLVLADVDQRSPIGRACSAAADWTDFVQWPSENVSPSTKRAVASGMQIFIGDIGAIAGVLIYRPAYSDNFYRKSHIVAVRAVGRLH